MTDNPYKSPPNHAEPPAITASAEVDLDHGPKPPREARLVVLAVLLTAALIIARVLHAGDLFSLFRVSIPIFLLSVIAYYFGLRHGAQ